MKRINVPLVSGFLLVFVTIFSYVYFFSQYPITRDVPWVSYLMLAGAVMLMIAGVRRAKHKVWSWIVAVIGFGFVALVLVANVVGMKMLPAAHGAPRVGQKAPEFALRDTHNNVVTLSSLTASAPRGVLLIFYRGYW